MKIRPVFDELEPRVLLSGSPAPENSNIPAVQSAASEVQQQAEQINEVLFIDAQVENYSNLLSDFDRNVEVVVIGEGESGVDFITQVLTDRQDVSAIHIFSHGSDGEIHLGNDVLNSANLAEFSGSLSFWGNALTSDADILIYGCDVGKSGQFVADLASITGADVAASNDLTGAESYSADAELETVSGDVETTELLTQQDFNDADILLTDPVISADAIYTWIPGAATQPNSTGGTLPTATDGFWEFTGTEKFHAESFDGFNAEDATIEIDFEVGNLVDDGHYLIFETGGNVHGTSLWVERTGGENFLRLLVQYDTDERHFFIQNINSMTGVINAAIVVDPSTNGSSADGNITFYVTNDGTTTSQSLNGILLNNWAGSDNTSFGGKVSSTSAEDEFTGNFRNFIGKIGEVNFYDQPLTQTQVELAAASMNRAPEFGYIESTGDWIWDANQPNAEQPSGTSALPTTVSSGLSSLGQAWDLSGTGFTSGGFDRNTQTKEDATFDMWFKTGDLTEGNYYLFETGGNGWGNTLWLEVNSDGDYILHLHVQEQSDSGNKVFLFRDITDLKDEYVYVAYSMVTNAVNGSVDLYVNGENEGSVEDSYLGSLIEWAGGNATGVGRLNSSVSIEGDYDLGTFSDFEGQIARANYYASALNGSTILGIYEEFTADADSQLPQISEDNQNASGTTVAEILGNKVSDPDDGAVEGIAISEMTGNGHWEFQLSGETDWNTITLSAGNVFHLGADDSIRYVPDGENGEEVSITYYAWDQTNGVVAGTQAVLRGIGGVTAYSATNEISTISITDVNDAPGLNGGFTYIKYDWTDGNASLPDDAPSLVGVSGATEVERGYLSEIADPSSDDGSQFAFHYTGTITITNAGTYTFSTSSDDGSQLFIDSELIVDNDGYHSLRTITGDKYLAAGTYQIDVTFYEWVGGDQLITSFSGPDTADEMVRIGNVSLPVILENNADPDGISVSDLIVERFSDADAGAVSGIAITELGDALNKWQYSLDAGANWIDMSVDTGALHLAGDALVRLLPDGMNGENSHFVFHAWDQTNGVISGANQAIAATGGFTAYSVAQEVALAAVDGINQQPGITSYTGNDTVQENELADYSNAEEARYSGTIDAVISDGDTEDTHTYVYAGSLTVGGLTAGEMFDATQVVVNSNGTFTITNALFNSLPAGETLTVSFDYIVRDSSGAANDGSDSETIAVTITGTNDAPQIGGFEYTKYNWPNSSGNVLPENVAGFEAATGSILDTGTMAVIEEAATEDGSNFAYHFTGTISIEAAGIYSFQTRSDDGSLLLIDGAVVVDNNGTHAARTVTETIFLTAGTYQVDVLFFERGGPDSLTTAYSGPDTGDTFVNMTAHAENLFASVTEDEINNTGTTIAELLGNAVLDEDASALKGIAITGLGTSNGGWEYKLNGETTWNSITLGAGEALHLRAIDSIRFNPDGIDGEISSVTYRAWDQSNGALAGSTAVIAATGGETAYSTETLTAAITVTAVNDAPEITSQSTFTVAEDTDYSINWLSINDVDASGDDLTLELSVLEGTLTFASLAGVSLNSGNNGESEIELAGTIAEINAVLAGLKYRADSHYNGNDTLSITLTDNEGSEVDTSVAITVTAVNDKPTFNAPANVSVAEDDAVKLTGLSITDLDANEVGGEISITLGVTSGILTFVDLSSLTLLNGTANSSSSIELRGTLANINAALGDLYYQGNLNFNGSDTLALTVNDLANHGSSGALTDSANVGISVTPVNDRPTLDSPAGISLDEDSAIKVDGLAINDVEAGDLSVSISVSEGTLIFRTLTGLSITSGANFTNSVELRGTAAGLNVALGDLFYQGNLHFNGTDSLEVEVNDLGNGGGVALSSAASVTITVLAQNDAPVLTLPGSQTVDEDTTLQITGISVADVDVDEGTGQLSVSLSVANGTLDVTDLSGITISSGSNNSSALTLTGSLADLNNALANLFYLGDSNFNGSDSLVVGVKDLGNTGGSALIDNGAVGISVTPVADTPFLSVVEISGSQGQTQRLVIEAEAGAENEILSVIISGLPGGSSLSAGSLVGTSWILSSADLPGLTLTLPDKFAADFEAQVTALSIDGLSIAGVTQSLTASIDPVFVTPNDNGNSDNNDIDSQGVIIDPVFDSFNFDANSLNFLEAGSSLQFNQDFLSDDALGVIANLFNFNLSINTEVADSGIIDQEVADIKVYDLSPLTEGEQSFILDLVQNVETDEEVDTVEEEEEDSFSVESAALQELSIKNIMEDTITQDYLDTRLSLEDTLQGEFDCLINDTLVK